MKNFGKRVLALTACFAMVISLISQNMISVYAENTDDLSREYEIYPIPHHIEYSAGGFIIRPDVNVIYESKIDNATKNHLKDVVNIKKKNYEVTDGIAEKKTNVLVGVYGSGEFVDQYVQEHYEINASVFQKYGGHYVISANDEIIILGADTDAAFYGITSLEHIFHQMEGSTIRYFTIKDYADTNIRGFIEGYYGNPWSNEDRMSLMEFGGDFKMTSYIFAPKNDPYHTSKWRELYPDGEIKEIKKMVEVGNASKCRFVWTAHPFMGGFNSSDVDGEVASLLNKFEQLYSVGVRQFGVLGDDVGSLNRDIVIQVMTAVSNWAKEKGDVYDSVFCPAGYNHAWQGDYSELNDYDKNFPDNIQIFWTGEAVCQPVEQKTLDHFRNQNATNGQRRSPLFWLNWPVNDINGARLMMGKGSLLHTDIHVEDLAGVVTNPMQEAEASKVAIFAVADYAWNVKDFDDDQSWADSFDYIDENAADELHTLAKHMSNPQPNGHGLVLAESEELQPLINELKDKLKNGESIETTGNQLIKEMNTIIDACVNFHKDSKNENLKKELTPFTRSLKDLTTAIKAYIQAAIALEKGNQAKAFDYYSDASATFENSKKHVRTSLNSKSYVSPGSTHLIPLAQTINEAISDDINTYVSSGDLPVIFTAVSNFDNFYSGTIDNICDGNNQTFAWVNGYEAAGQYFQVNINQPITIYGIDVLNGTTGKPSDTFGNAKLQYTTDGKTWIDVNGDIYTNYQEHVTVTDIQLDNVVAVRYICTAVGSQNKWPAMREFTLQQTKTKKKDPTVITTEVIRTSPEEGWSVYSGEESNAIDGNDNTGISYAVRWGGSPSNTMIEGDYFGIKISQPIVLGKIHILQGPNDSNDDYMKQAELQYSLDGVNWTTIQEVTTRNIDIDVSSQNITAQYVRLLKKGNQANWFGIREFKVDQQTPGLIRTPSWGIYSGNENNVFDGNDDTFVWYNKNIAANDYVGVNLYRPMTLGKVHIVQSNGSDYFKNGELQYSLDGETWTKIQDVNTSQIDLDLSSHNISAQYVRLVSKSDQGNWYQLREFQVEEKENQWIRTPNNEGWQVYSGSESAATDGDDSTYVWYKIRNDNVYGAEKDCMLAGDYFGMNLGRVMALGEIHILQGNSSDDYMKEADLQYSVDGEHWVTIQSYSDAREINLDLSNKGIVAKYVRLVKTGEEQHNWCKVNEFQVSEKQDYTGVVYTNVTDYEDVGANYGEEINYMEPTLDVTLNQNEYIGLKLDRIHELEQITINTSVSGLTLQVSMNSREWETVSTGKVNKDARYIRLINETGHPVTFNMNQFEVTTIEAKEKSIVGTNYSGFNGEFINLFDGDWTTASQFKDSQNQGKYIIFDLGNEIDLHSFKAVCTDSEWDYARHAKFSVSTDGEYWEDIMTMGNQDSANEGELENTDNINEILPDHEISYNTKSVTGLDIKARYLKFEITRTKVGADKWVRFQEFEINGGEYIPTLNNPTFEGNKETQTSQYIYLIDKKLNTMYSFDSGNIIYHVSEEKALNTLKLIQNDLSLADVYVRTDSKRDEWIKLGTLSQIINEFSIDDAILDVKLVCRDNSVHIKEIQVYASEIQTVDKVALQSLLNNPEDTSNWTQNAKEAYLQAYQNAQNMKDNPYVTQLSVDAMTQTLQKAIDDHQIKGDASLVKQAIEELDKDLYTVQTYKQYEKAVNAANEALKDSDNLSEDMVSELLNNLKTAKNALRFNPTKFEEASLYRDDIEELLDSSANYTQNSFKNFENQYKALQLLLADGAQKHSPNDFETAKTVLKIAIDQLVLVYELPTLVNEYDENNADIYTSKTWQAYKKAIEEGKTILVSGTETTVENAIKAIKKAKDEFIVKGNPEALKALINLAKDKNADDYTKASFKAMEEELDKAEKLDLDNMSEEDIQEAAQALQEKVNALVPVSSLKALVKQAKGYKEDDYTVTSYKALQKTIEQAESCCEDGTYKEIEDATLALSEAFKQMKKRVDSQEIKDYVDSIELKDPTKYTKETYTDYQEAYDKLNGLLDHLEDVSKEEFLKVKTEFETAKNALKLISSDITINSDETDKVETSDSMMIGSYSLLGLISLAGIILVMKKRKHS